MDICLFCQRFVDEEDLIRVEGGEVAHRDCAEDWADEDDDD